MTIRSTDKSFNKKYLLHFIPFVLVVIAAFFEIYLESAEYKIALLEQKIENIPVRILSLIIPLHGAIYTYISIKLVTAFNKNLKKSYSDIEKINLNWLAYLVFANLVIWAIVIMAYSVTIIFGQGFHAEFAIYIAISIFIYSIGYKSLQQPEILAEPNFESSSEIKKKSYQKSGMDSIKSEHHLSKLKRLFDEDKVHRNPNLNLSELAKKLEISQHNLSELINTQLNQTFYDFVNR